MENEIRLRITKHDDEHIGLYAIDGVEHHGFGTFLYDLLPSQIECDEFSKGVLLCAKDRHGFNGMEIWADNRIAWGSPAVMIIMPVSEISRHEGANWLNEITTTVE